MKSKAFLTAGLTAISLLSAFPMNITGTFTPLVRIEETIVPD